MIMRFNKKFYKAIFLYSLFAFLIGCTEKKEYQPITENEQLELFYKEQINLSIHYLEEISSHDNIQNKRNAFWKARKSFKTIEPILAFLDFDNYNYLNQANLLKIEEEDATSIKIKNPVGFQVVEEILYEDRLEENELKKVVQETIKR